MIQITLQFNTIDEAIVFLSKQHPVAKVRNAAAIEPIVGAAGTPPLGEGAVSGEALVGAAPSAHAASAAASTTNKRKPRADAGKKRGSYKNVEAPVEQATPAGAVKPAGDGRTVEGQQTPPPAASTPQTAAPTAPAEADNARPSGVVPSGAAAPAEATATATEKDAQDAIQKVFTQQGGPQLALDTLASFGVKRCRDLKPEQRGEFVAKCNEILAGKGKS